MSFRGGTTAVGASSSSSCNASKRTFICWIFRFATILNVGLVKLEMVKTMEVLRSSYHDYKQNIID